MKYIYFLLVVILLASSVLLGGCSKPLSQNGDKIDVMVSILPQVDFVERIGGDKVEVSAMIPPGFSPATYEPAPEQIKTLSEANIYIKVGKIAFEEAQMEKLIGINSNMKVIDSSDGVEFRSIESHSHEEIGGEYDHEEEAGDDPHTWLSPDIVKIQAENIYEALVELRPEYRDYFLANKNNFVTDLDSLDSQLKDAFAPIAGKTILVFHPAFGYLADTYGFYQESIEIEGKDPTIENLQNIIDEARADGIKVIFVQKQFSTKSAQVVADSIGGVVVQIDPLAQDYFANLKDMAYTISENLK